MDKRQLKELIEKEKSKGTSVSLIRDKLVAKGYPKDIIDDVLDLKVPGFSVSKIKLLALWCGIFAIIITMFFVFLNVPITKVTPGENITVVKTDCDSPNPEVCLFRKAIETNDKTLCSKIRSDMLNGLCNGDMTPADCAYFEFAQYPRQKMAACYNDKAADDNNFTLCLFSGEMRNCLDAIYAKNGKGTVCDGSAVCIAYVAERIGDYSLCSNPDQCYISNAITFLNPDFCTKVSDAQTRKNCISFFTKSSKDMKYCFYDSDATNSLDCVKRWNVAENVLSSEDTMKISALVSKSCSDSGSDLSVNSDYCIIKYAFSLQMPFLCEKITDAALGADCPKLIDGSKEFPISFCETFKYPKFQENCVDILTRCNSLSPDARPVCFRREID